VLLLDASVWMSALDRDDRFYADALALTTASADMTALDLTLYEVANAVTRRFGTVAPAKAAVRGVLAACTRPPAQVDIDTIAATVEIAAEHKLTAYDAAYVAVAGRYGWTLVSTDIKDLVSRELAVTPDVARGRTG
jgi:predicted nucleic acid-binding protein